MSSFAGGLIYAEVTSLGRILIRTGLLDLVLKNAPNARVLFASQPSNRND